MKLDPSKVAAVLKTKPSANAEVLNSFVCMVAWNDIFILHFDGLIRPLWDLANTKEKSFGFLSMKKFFMS